MSTAIGRSLPFVLAGILVAGLIALLVISSRTHTDFDFNGQWSGNRHLPPGDDPGAAYTMGWVVLTIKEGKFEMVDMGIPTSGTIDYQGNRIVLQTDSLMMLPLSHGGPNAKSDHPDITVTANPDGTLKFDNPKAIDRKPLILTRDKK